MQADTNQETPRSARRATALLYVIFTVSGVAGLIYESVWARYLKLFLGNDAYAQALVLVIFLGGLALGSELTARISARIKRPLFAYACVEGLVAAIALFFHPIFTSVTGWSFDVVAPALGSPVAIEVFKWLLGSLLILPQAVLLGTTFPLLAAGVARIQPGSSGRVLGWLYFTNSLGGAMGVLISGFVLVPAIGLPGAVLIAGLLNVLVGGAVALLERGVPDVQAPALDSRPPRREGPGISPALCLLVAAVTGAASLIYEIAWVRLLALILGSSNHAFELMLSAFILGLALGGFYIKSRSDRLRNPLRTLGIIQLAMGTLACATLFFYREAFLLMGWLMQALQRSEPGYMIFSIGSHAIALLVMLPATFCAGMTLPLLTNLQLASGAGERVIGRTYAANTLGSIVAVLWAVHWLLPQLGVKGALLVGAAFDLLLGAWLVGVRAPLRVRVPGAAVAAGVLVLAIAVPHLDPQVLSAGLFQNRRTVLPTESNIIYHEDGKTSALTVTRHEHPENGEYLGFSTSGKGNGSLFMKQGAEDGVTADEPSFGMIGLMPLLLKPEAKELACIGLGTGLTAHAALTSPLVERMDVIEIEQRTLETAAFFTPAVPRALGDPRSHVHVADAKTFFSSHPGRRYDAIVSNPSNLWVSGVSGLFTEEFYQVVRRALKDDGLLVQWISLYTTDAEMVGSVVAAVDAQFSDYALYLATNHDLLIIAAKQGRVPRPSAAAFAYPEAKVLLQRYGIRNLGDVQLRYVGDRSSTRTYFTLLEPRPNSDYWPLLEARSLNAFYMGRNLQTFTAWHALLKREWLAQAPWQDAVLPTVPQGGYFREADYTRAAVLMRERLLRGKLPEGANLNVPMLTYIDALDARTCPADMTPHLVQGVTPVVAFLAARLSADDLARVWRVIENKRCAAQVRAAGEDAWGLLAAISKRDHEQVIELSEKLVPLPEDDDAARTTLAPFPLVARAGALYELGRYDELIAFFQQVSEIGTGRDEALKHALTLLVARAIDAKAARQSGGVAPVSSSAGERAAAARSEANHAGSKTPGAAAPGSATPGAAATTE